MSDCKPKHPIDVNWLSEEGNDQWVAYLSNYKRGGYFIEGGATAGLNNSALVLEKEFDWDGLAINPNPDHYYYIIMKQQRKRAVQAALWDNTGYVNFHYAPFGVHSKNLKSSSNGNPIDMSYLSMVENATNIDHRWINERRDLPMIQVPSITFPDLLERYDCPKEIDYVGLDIERSEFQALSTFPFDTHHVKYFSIENSVPCAELLERNGYKKVKNPWCPKKHEHHYIHLDYWNEYPFK